MQYFLFILANALLFLRPSEFVPELGDAELYRYVIAACLVVSVPLVLRQLFARFEGVPPIAGCVLGLLPAVVLSNLFGGNAQDTVDNGIEFLKVVVYFLLLLALVTTTERLRSFLRWLGLFSAALTVIAVLRYHADVALPAPTRPTNPLEKKMHGTFVVDQVRDPETGDFVDVRRMCGTGIFNDPNDLALVLVTAIPLALYWLTDPRKKAMRPLWLALLVLFAYALMLTHSRGGFLALLSGAVVLLHARYGGKKMLLLGLLCLPFLFALFAGRMTSISANDGTGQSRIQLWSDGLVFFQQAPLFGIGMENYRSFSSHVAHNSFIHAYAEMGLLGGTLFLGAFYFAVRGLFQVKQAAAADVTAEVEDAAGQELRRLHPFLVATFVSYAVGIAFLSRSYVVPTYLFLGLATVYLRLWATELPVTLPNWNRLVLPRLAGVSFSFLLVSYTFVRLFVNWR